MKNKYQNRYRIPSARLRGWDYGWDAAYFVTLCTKGRYPYFGRVAPGEMILTPAGQAARDCWYAIPDHFPFVRLGEFIVMPNHVHGIVIIDKRGYGFNGGGAAGGLLLPQPPGNRFGPQSQNLPSIVRGYKIGVTKSARLTDSRFAWQARYHDHIIRTVDAHRRIAWYIRNNPRKWSEDRFYP